MPGPGAYSPPKINEMPSFSFRPKASFFVKKEGPGPGTYDPSSMDKTPNGRIGTSARESGSFLSTVQKQLPGPGAYAHKESGTGPKWGFGESQRSKLVENGVPGPGQYKMLPMIGN